MWGHHYHCCGSIVGYDASLTTVSDGLLEMRVDRRSNGWYTDIIDTKPNLMQKYGYFEARMKIPKGTGLWPAFWMYDDGSGWVNEIDGMEVCANPIGANGGNDASLLHTHVHWAGGGDAGRSMRTVDLSLAFHTYAFEWRADRIVWYLDGAEVWRYTDVTHIPTHPLPIILNLGVGGSWCGAPTSSTPDLATMYVDWVRARP
jgi:beta-glucanase (GH16 family)